MSWTGDPVWLADVLRAEGLHVIEHDGWRERGHGDFRDIRGVLCHHTGGGNPNDWRYVRDGEPKLPGPLAQLVLEKDGTYRVIAAGVCWHAGRGSWPGWPTDNANYHVIGIEAVSRGREPFDWTSQQIDAYQRGTAAILRRIGRDAADCVAHREYSSEGKIDPAGLDMHEFRRAVQGFIEGGAPMSAAEVEQIQEFITAFCGPIGSDIKDVREQLCGHGQRDAGQYAGWPQLDGLTLVEAIADIRTRLEKLELGGTA
ncbi:N-acetylmuramoyl-L-alanine amidase [Nocardia uniformis]|uniref:N-acetylmuramoyl-L-alanine amidase n=1 Tax=Nocardia uniformis TaxID=53432 RepID=A0A849BRA0_9NOCA|nr:N-acetylmuramoyl-L-alanine amidase [Nocardia uniformis]NNH68614.1 N-acetylmuramoyl-L-alanine amidase [Nocardia uniformis]